MPALAPVAKVIQIRYVGTDAADIDLGSHLTFQYSGAAPTSSQLAGMNASIGTAWVNGLAPLVDTGFTLTKIINVDLTSQSSAVAESVVNAPGTRAGVALPLNVAFSLQEQTNLRRRGGHWRVQQRCGVQADLANPQNWTAAFVSSVIAGFHTFIGGIEAAVWPGGGTLTQVGVQYYGPPNRTITSSTGRVRTVSTPLPVPAVWPVVSLAANTRLGSQRKRLGKSGG